MPPLLRNTLALIAGVIIGAFINMAVIKLGPSLIPPPAGVDVNSAASLAKGMQLFEPRHFVMPFLAHALHAFVGALITYLLAASYKRALAMTVGVIVLLGGIAASFMIPAPAWFIALDLLAAYLPMAWLGSWLGARIQRGSATPVAAR